MYLIYNGMKAKEIMKKYNITRNTLSNWVRRGLIKVDTTPSGRYIYLDKKEFTKHEENDQR